MMGTLSRQIGNRTKRRLGGPLIALALLAVASPLACSQIYSRPSGVVLIARLESLSVTATAAVADSSPAHTAATPAHSVAIVTSWVVRSNLTTLRLVGYFAGDQDAPVAANGSSIRTAAPPIPVALAGESSNHAALRPAGILQPGGSGLTLVTQPSGDTNNPKTRTDSLSLALDSAAQPPSESHTGTLSIWMQAL